MAQIIAHQRREDGALRQLLAHRQRSLAVLEAVGLRGAAGRHPCGLVLGRGFERTAICERLRRRKSVHEIRVDVVAILQDLRQQDLLLVDRVAQLQPEVFPERKTQTRRGADRVGLVGRELRRFLDLLEQIDAPRHRELPLLAALEQDRRLGVEAEAEQVALADAHLAQEPVRGGETAGN